MHSVCLLTAADVGRLENYADFPNCKHHRHLNYQEAVEGIAADLLVVVGEEYGLEAVREQDSNGRRWAGRASQGYQVFQFVER